MSDQHRRVDRRTTIAALGTTAIATVTGCTQMVTGGASLEDQLETVRKATKKYTDPKKALQDGFKISGPYVPGMGWHFMHPGRIKSAAKNGLKRTEAQILTYNKQMELGAAEWGVPKQAIDETPDLFANETAGATESWHPHKSATHVFAKPDGKQTPPKNVSFPDWTTNSNWAEFRPPNPDLSSGDEIALNWGQLRQRREKRKHESSMSLPPIRTSQRFTHGCTQRTRKAYSSQSTQNGRRPQSRPRVISKSVAGNTDVLFVTSFHD